MFRVFLPTFAKFCGCQEKFTLRMPFELEVILRDALQPTRFHKSERRPNVKGVVPHRDLRMLDGRWSKFIRPVIDGMDFDAASWLDLCCPFGSCRQGEEAKRLIVINGAVAAFASLHHACSEGFTRTHV